MVARTMFVVFCTILLLLAPTARADDEDGTVFAITISGSDVYAGGDFTDAGGNPNADRIARWNGVAWQALGGGLDNGVHVIVVSGSNVYVGGAFTDAGGNSNADRIARWNGGAWHPLGVGLNNWVNVIVVSGATSTLAVCSPTRGATRTPTASRTGTAAPGKRSAAG